MKQSQHKHSRIMLRRVTHKRYLAPLLVIALYVFAIGFSDAYYMADSGGYVVSILAYAGVSEYIVEHPAVRDHRSENAFWDFGHLLWRPLGLVLFKAFSSLSNLIVGPDPAHNVLFLLRSVVLIAGLMSAVLLYTVIERLTGRRLLAVFSVFCFIFSHAFLNFAQTGSSYIVGLGFLIGALYLLLKDKAHTSRLAAIGAGLACAGAITMWFVYALVIPATVVAPLLLFGWNRQQKLSVLYAGVAFVFATAIAYLPVMAAIGIHNSGELREWIAVSTHGVRTNGLARMLFGLPRSFIHMSDAGMLFKRFLLHDPFNPVTALDLVQVSLWKVVLFYLALGVIMIGLLVSSSRRVLVLLALTAVPLISFAIRFDGGAVERYLPFYPLIFISLAWVLSQAAVSRFLKVIPALFFGFAVLTNLSLMASVVLDRQNQRTLDRIQAVIPQLKPNSWLVTSHLQDDLVNFQASFPFEPVNRHNTYRVYPLVWPNTDQAAKWREEFASTMLKAWDRRGDVWISKRVFNTTPEAAWKWVEGDDPRVRWSDIHQFVRQFQTGTAVGGADGFVLLEKTEANRQLLELTRQH